jgi:hypothetical protein
VRQARASRQRDDGTTAAASAFLAGGPLEVATVDRLTSEAAQLHDALEHNERLQKAAQRAVDVLELERLDGLLSGLAEPVKVALVTFGQALARAEALWLEADRLVRPLEDAGSQRQACRLRLGGQCAGASVDVGKWAALTGSWSSAFQGDAANPSKFRRWLGELGPTE